MHHGVRPPGKGTSLVTANALERPSVPRSYKSLMKKPARRGPIILDEFDYVPLDVESTRQLLKAISTRYGRRGILFTINIEFGKRSTVPGDEKIAAAVVDAVVHHGHPVEFGGLSRRMDGALAFIRQP